MPSFGSAERHGSCADHVGGVGTSGFWYFGPTAHPARPNNRLRHTSKFHLLKCNKVFLAKKVSLFRIAAVACGAIHSSNLRIYRRNRPNSRCEPSNCAFLTNLYAVRLVCSWEI